MTDYKNPLRTSPGEQSNTILQKGDRVKNPSRTSTEEVTPGTPEKDEVFSLWGAEKLYYFLYRLNKTIEHARKEEYLNDLNSLSPGGTPFFEFVHLKKNLPNFNSLKSFHNWIKGTNPKAVKELMEFFFRSLCEWGEIDNSPEYSLLNYPNNDWKKYHKGLANYLSNGVEVHSEEEIEEMYEEEETTPIVENLIERLQEPDGDFLDEFIDNDIKEIVVTKTNGKRYYVKIREEESSTDGAQTLTPEEGIKEYIDQQKEIFNNLA